MAFAFGMEDVYAVKFVHFLMQGCSLLVHLSGYLLRVMGFSKANVFAIGSLFMLSYTAHAQYGNEWINYSQQYYKIPVTQTGIYRLTRDDLSNAGVPVNTIDPRRIQIFRRGVEQSINFSNNQQPANGIFESGEYLEFFGEKNDGATDVDLYKNPAHQPHAYMNLYADTAWYFLTWNLLAVQGKRMSVLNPELNVGNIPADAGFTNTNLTVLNNQYSAGETYLGRVQNSFFDEGEGWTGPVICNSGCTTQQDLTTTLAGANTTMAPPALEMLLVGRLEGAHQVEVYVGQSTSALRLLTTVAFINFQNINVSTALQWSDIAANGNLVVRVKPIGASTALDWVSISYLKVNYNRTFDLNGAPAQIINMLPKAGGKSYIEIQNAASGLRLFDVTDVTNASIIGTYAANSNLTAIINGTAASRKIFTSSAFATPILKKVSFRQIMPSLHDYLIISNKSLRKAGLGYSDPVKAYASYRASNNGGSYDTLLVNIDLLYNQFNYGETSPRAVYQFLKFMANGGNPKYLLLIGKGMEINFAYDRNRVFLPSDYKDLVPVAGFPGSDLTYSAGLKGTTYQPSIATGRVTASTPAEVAAYLNKIIDTEAQPFDALWRKDVLHLSGGLNPGEPQKFRSYVDGFKSIADKIFFGANVSTQSKQTLDPTEQVNIAPKVNAGVSLVTFFGHSSTSNVDLDLGSVNNPDFGYNNTGKYPAFLINGCNVGHIYSNNRVFPEDWILAQNKGAKNFLAHSSFGYENMLRFYSHLFYHFAFTDSAAISKGIGDVQVQVADSLFRYGGPDIFYLSILHQMVLMGDPAIPIFGARKPDYAIENEFLNKISFDGKPVTAATTSFGIQYKIRNYGQARNDSIRVTLTRTFQNNTSVTYDTLVHPVLYEETFVFVLDNPANTGGSNSFTIKIDDPNALSELNEGNNIASLSLFIPSSATYNLVPYAYGIVSNTIVELVFQNTNQAPAYREFQLEIDSVKDFNSAFKQQFTMGANVLARKTVTIPSKDSAVYYWRSRLAQPTADESAEWFTSSFMYITNAADGWAQGRAQQMAENTLVDLALNANGKLVFPEKISSVYIQNFGSANPTDYLKTTIQIDGLDYTVTSLGQFCRNNTINLVAFDKITGTPYAAIPFNLLDSRNCGREPQAIINFTQAEAEAASNGMDQAISNLAVNDSVVLYTMGNPNVTGWSSGLLTALGGIGLSSSQLVGFQTGEPLIVFGKKGATPGSARVIRTTFLPANEQALVVNETMTSRKAEGSITSSEIGPAKQWYSLARNVRAFDVSDIYKIEVIGIALNNDETVLYQGIDAHVDLSFIDPMTYSKIRLKLTTRDEDNLTPVDWRNWVVNYEPVAEGILLSRSGSGPIEKHEGEMWTAKYVFKNITKYDFPFAGSGQSMNAELKVVNTGFAQQEVSTFQIEAPLPKDSTLFEIPVSTIGLGGLNNVSATINNAQAREQYLFNDNLPIEKYLSVMRDLQPPLLEVTVDGRYLQNGDVVSPNPLVNISLIDENQFWFKTDTTGVFIYIKNLETDEVKRINFTDATTHWTPATATNNFNVLFSIALDPGEYQLSAQAQDAAGNQSGADAYSVSFVVTDKNKLNVGDPFPNPTDSWISFPVRIAGNELPSSFNLKIFAPNGRLIQKVGLEDVSGFYIGTNSIRLNMDELDNGGLVSGVYFYRLEVKADENFASRSGSIVYVR